MKRDRGFWKEAIKRAVLSIGVLGVMSSMYLLVNRYTGRERDLTTFIDNLIPFNKYFIFFYVFWYFYIGIFIWYFCLSGGEKFRKLLLNIGCGMAISCIIYLIFPTTVPRPDYTPGTGLADLILKAIWGRDNPYNCFPSIHVINALVINIYVWREANLNKYVKAASLLSAAAIIYSTFAVKQHVVMDAISAAVVAYGLYFVINYKEVLSAGRQKPEVYKAA